MKLYDIERYGGGGLIHKYYGGSIMKALNHIYPEHRWIPWKFRYTPQSLITLLPNSLFRFLE